MAENKLKERWKAGKAAVNGWLAIPSGFSAEVMAQCGWDSVTVDMQNVLGKRPLGERNHWGDFSPAWRSLTFSIRISAMS